MPFTWVERQVAGAIRRGASLDRLLTDSMIEVRHGDNRDIITPMRHLLVCLNTVLSAGDAVHALAKGPVSRLYPDVGVRMFLGSASLEEAILALARLYASASSPVEIHLRTEQDLATLCIHIDADDQAEAAIIEEIYLVWIFMHCLRFLGRAPPLAGMTVRDPFHFNHGGRHWGIGAPVSYGPVSAFSFPRRLLAEAPISRAGENAQWECHQLWFDFLRSHAEADALEGFVSGGDFVRFGDLARDSGVSPNTLRRQMRLADGGFRDNRRRALLDAAVGRLRGGSDTLETIAVDLGYSDGRSLRRFLKTATGLTPQQLRDHGDPDAVQAERRALEKARVLSAEMMR